MERDEAKAELPVEIRDKLSHTPLEGASWHQDVEKVCTTPPTSTQEEKATEEELKKNKVEDDASGRKSYLKTLYTMHLYTNIKCKIWNKLKNMLIYISI